MCRPLTLICLLLHLFQPVRSQSTTAALVRTITVENGLPQGWVASMVQDRQGFIWTAATGLSRYDGRSFIHYQHSNADTGSLSGNQVSRLYIDDQNNLWVQFADTTAIDMVNATTGHIRHISAEPAFIWLHSLYGSQVVVQQCGQYFYGHRNQLVAFDIITGKRHPIILPTGEALLSYCSRKNKVLFSTNKALYAVEAGHLRRLVSFPFRPISIDSTNKLLDMRAYPLMAMAWDKQGNLLCPATGGFFVCHPDAATAQYIALPEALVQDSFLKQASGKVFSIIKGKLFGISKEYQLLPVDIPNLKWVNNPAFFDQSGLLWLASGDNNGIRVVDVQPNDFHANNYVNGFSHDVLLPWLHNPIPGLDYSSYMLRWAKDPTGNTWISCPQIEFTGSQMPLHFSLVRLHPDYTTTVVSFKDAEPRFFSFSRSRQCWAVVQQHLKRWLAKVNLQNGSYQRVATLPDDAGLYNDYLTTIADKVCVVLEDSLLLYDTTTLACTRYTRSRLRANANLLMARPDPQNSSLLWIATQGSGMVALDIATGKTKNYTTATGLPDSTVYAIMADKRGYFWCSSNRGIFRFNPRDGSCFSFTVKDGLPGNEFNRYHFMEMPDGRFAFGGPAGYVLFHPDSIYVDDFQPPAFLSAIEVNSKPLAEAGSQWKEAMVSSLQSIALPYDQNFLTLHFAGLEYGNTDKMQYRYKMEGLDKDWILAGTEAVARYTALGPGQYTFWVNASNTSGVWSRQVRKLIITIRPPWWRTAWAYLLYVLLGGTIIYALYRNGLQRARAKQQIILQQRETEQLKAIDEMKGRFFSNITHEFRTPLSLIIGPAGQMMEEGPAEHWKKNIQMIDRNARRMLLLINQLLDMAKLEAGNMKITLRRGNMGRFVREEVHAFEAAARLKRIDLGVSVSDDENDYLFDAEKLHTILSNLLSNAVKFTPAGGQVSCQLTRGQSSVTGVASSIHSPRLKPGEPGNDSTLFQIRISDTGIGISPEKLPLIFNRFYQAEDATTRNYEGTGIGLALAKELTALLNGTLTVISELGKGTSFSLEFLLDKATNEAVPMYEPGLLSASMLPTIYEQETQIPLTDTDKPLILVVEDNEELSAFIAQTFSPNYRVLTAANGNRGLQVAQTELPEVIISDLMMPGMDGQDFCTAIKSSPVTDHIAFILLTAKTAAASIVANLQNKADDYLTKPFMVAELQLRVRNLLERQQTLRRYFHQQLVLAHPGNGTATADEPITLHPFIEELHAIIEKHLDDSAFSVDKLATAVAMSRRTLTRKLSGIADVSPAELIKKYRLKKAAELLQSGMGVAETTYQVGYESPASFSTLFKEAYGVPPSEYRSRNAG